MNVSSLDVRYAKVSIREIKSESIRRVINAIFDTKRGFQALKKEMSALELSRILNPIIRNQCKVNNS